jgi:hypothetical protein
MDYIDKVIYINLDHRTDRKEQVEKELSIFPTEKVLRFEAIKHAKGGIGCSLSHIGALELAIQNNWKNVLIVEDDLQWRNFEKGVKIFESLVVNPFDVILLSGHNVSYNKKTYKLTECCARTAYLVNNHYFQTLLTNFKDGVACLQRHWSNHNRGDRYWNRLQKKDNWFIVMPQMCMQRPSFSDIEKKNVNYNKLVS